MKHKKLNTLLAALAIATSTGALIAPTHPAQASKLSTIKSTTGYRKVRLLKNVNVRKIHWKTPLYKSTLGAKQYVSKGEVVSIKWSGTNFGWYMKVPGNSGEYTISKKLNDTSWFTFNTKKPKKKVYSKIPNTKNGFSGNSYATGNVKVTFDSVYNVKLNDSKANKKTTEVLFTGALTNHSQKSVIPDVWISNHIDIFTQENKLIIPMGFDFSYNENYKFSKQLANALEKVAPGKTIKFAISTTTSTHHTITPTDNYALKVIDNTNSEDEYLSNTLTLQANNDNFTGKVVWL